MVDIFSFIYLIVGMGFTYLAVEVMARKNKGLFNLTNALRKKHMVAFLETDKAIYCKRIVKMYRNLGVTEDKELIVIPRSSPKPCVNVGGGMIIHGDLYKSVTVPQELRKFIEERLEEKWKDEDIAQFLEEIETTPPNILKKLYFEKKTKPQTSVPVVTNGNSPEAKAEVNLIDAKKYDIYMALPSVIKDFIYTGINRVSIHAMLRELVYQRELEHMGKRNWLMIAVAVIIILIGVGFAIRFILGTPQLLDTISKAVTPSRIAP